MGMKIGLGTGTWKHQNRTAWVLPYIGDHQLSAILYTRGMSIATYSSKSFTWLEGGLSPPLPPPRPGKDCYSTSSSIC